MYLLGTEDSGRDVLSFIIYGTRLTIAVALMVTFLRFLVALIIGIASGYDHIIPKMLIEQFNNVFNAIPPILICILILSLPYLKTFTKTGSTIVFIFVLTLVEWAKLGGIVSERVSEIRQKDFIKSEVVIGKSNLHIIFANILPHIMPELFVLFFMEIARVLAILMQLGIFNVFIGNLRIVASTDAGSLVGKATSFEPEWSSMLGSAKNYIRTAPWIVFSSAIAFFTVVFGFNLIGEGLRIQLKKRAISQMSPNNALKGVIAMVVVSALITGPIVFSSLQYNDFNLNESEAVYFDAETALVGDPTHQSYIVNRLKSLSISPLEGTDYLVPFEELTYHWLESVSFDSDGSSLDNVFLYTYQGHEYTSRVIDARMMDLIRLDKETASRFEDKYVLIEPKLFRDEGWLNFAHKLLNETKARGVFILSDDRPPLNHIGTNTDKGIIAAIPSKYEALILNKPLTISVKSHTKTDQLTNIVGVIEGHPDENDPKCIILGFDLNYQDQQEGQRRYRFIFNFLSQLKANESKLTKRIMVVFWDGGALGEASGKSYYQSSYLYPIKNTEMYFELSSLKFNDGLQAPIYVDTQFISNVKPVPANFTNLMLDNMTLDYVRKDLSVYKREPFYYKWGIPTLFMGSDYLTDQQANDIGNLLIESIVFELY